MPLIRISLLPFLAWLPQALKTWKADLLASFSVSILLIPQCMAYAETAGLPPYYGLYASLLPPIVAAFWGSSPILSTGPAVVISLLTLTSLSEFARPQSAPFIQLAALLALLVGIIQLAMGVFKLGNLIQFISHPVIKGFVSSAGIIIAITQIPKLLDLPSNNHETLLDMLNMAGSSLDQANPYAFFLGLACLGLILSGKKLFPKVPIVFLVAAMATGLSWWFQGPWSIVGQIPQGLPHFQLPDTNANQLQLLLTPALIIALVGYVEAISIAKSFALKTRTPLNPNQEMIGQGLANMVASMSGTFPIGGSFSRSAVNWHTGVRSGLATVFTAGILATTLLVLTPLLYFLPQTTLAAIIISSVTSLIDFKGIYQLWKLYPRDGIVAGVTFLSTFGFAPHLDYGIGLGFLFSLITYAYRASRPPIQTFNFADLNFIKMNHMNIHPHATNRHVLGVTIDHSLIFTNADHFRSRIIAGIIAYPEIKYVLILSRGINMMDATAAEVIEELVSELREKRISLMFAGIKPTVAQLMYKTKMHQIIGKGNLFLKVKDALAYIHLKETAQKKKARQVIHKTNLHYRLIK